MTTPSLRAQQDLPDDGSPRHRPKGILPGAVRSRLSVIIPFLVILVFILDLATPLGLSVWLVYFVPVLLCLWMDRHYAIPAVWGATLLFLAAGYVFSPPGMHTAFALFNRILFAAIITGVSAVIWIVRVYLVQAELGLNAGRETNLAARGRGKAALQAASILDAELVPAIRAVRKSLEGIRGGTGAFSPEAIARSEETLARAEEKILFSKKIGSIGKSPPRWQDLSEIIETIIPLLRRQGIGIAIAPGSLQLYADPLLPEVFDELTDNTVKHGMVARSIRIGWQEEAGNLLLTVEDDGIGIPFSQKQQLFHDRVGRGLVLAREILGATGITIAETGIPEQGARFTLAVPEGKFRIR